MNKSLFAALVAATIAVPQLGFAQPPNLPQSAEQQRMIYNDAKLRREHGQDPESLIEARLARGRRFIKAKRATTRFQTRPFPLQRYLNTIWKDTREQSAREWSVQSALWNKEIKARGAKSNDMGDMYALAAVVSYEAHTGKRLKNSAFTNMRATFREFFLKTPFYQGASADEKQDYYEDVMPTATNALRMRREGDIKGAQADAAAFFDRWMGAGTEGALRFFAQFEEP